MKLLAPVAGSTIPKHDRVNDQEDWIKKVEEYHYTHIVENVFRLKAKLFKIITEGISRRDAKHSVVGIIHVIDLKCRNFGDTLEELRCIDR